MQDQRKNNPKPDLSEIELGETIKMVNNRKRDTAERPKKQKKPEEKEIEPMDDIIFDPLPEDPSDGSNPIKKFANWARQLF